MPALIISVRFHDGRYHGRQDWPPSPARLFQALIAGAAQGATLAKEDRLALAWLEGCKPPVIAAPPVRLGQGFRNFVPNNDLDAVGGDPRRVGEIRAPKLIRPILFNAEMPLLYVWTFDDAPEAQAHAQRIRAIAERLYQLGRGVDMAWAWGEILAAEAVEALLAAYGGVICRPSKSGDGRTLPVPLKGSLDSLTRRYEAGCKRFTTSTSNRTQQTVFAQPPKPRFRQVAYDSPPRRLLFDLVGTQPSWRLDRIVEFAELVRDKAAERLKGALKGEADSIDRILVGRGAAEADKAQRVCITPLPSIGHQHADHAIRRVLVDIPANCPLRADNVEWAFSGLLLRVSQEGEILCELAPAADRGMLLRYGIKDAPATTLWHTVTPAALPQQAARRRIDPARHRAEAKGGAERTKEEAAAASAVVDALRHAGMSARALGVRVQREPFEAKGACAEAFAPRTRFAKERLWHVEVALDAPQRGPLVIGDGRYLGLGLMAPVRRKNGVLAFTIESGLAADAEPAVLTRALRRAALARVQAEQGEGKALPLYITGHEANGAPARRGSHEHIAFAYDPARRRLLILAPHVLERRPPRRRELQHWSLLEQAMHELSELRAGTAGKLRLVGTSVDLASDALFAPAHDWETMTAYRALRHRKLTDAAAALAADIAEECRQLRLPCGEVKTSQARGIAGVGLIGCARLHFAIAVRGPILIGRDRHFGGGLFAGGSSR
jgi:CRISPR-associated protein Csb2